jgi:peptide-methionine (S)-S-oxide reductase
MDGKRDGNPEVAASGAPVVFARLKGVTSAFLATAAAASSPTYEQVSTGKTGHAEVTDITYDPTSSPSTVTGDILRTRPTTPNRQGADVGPVPQRHILPHREAAPRGWDYIRS